jgi:hypothetical protein
MVRIWETTMQTYEIVQTIETVFYATGAACVVGILGVGMIVFGYGVLKNTISDTSGDAVDCEQRTQAGVTYCKDGTLQSIGDGQPQFPRRFDG